MTAAATEITRTGDVQALEGSSNFEEPSRDPGDIPLSDLGLNINDNRINDVIVLSDDEEAEEPMYSLPSIDKDGFTISSLVWAKMENMSWWPGLIIDPSNAPHVTIEDPGKEMHLIVFFGSNKIKWRGKSKIRPFFKYFPMFKNKSSLEQFKEAIECVLKEVSRRFVLGTICPCLEEKSFSKETDKSISERFTNYSINRGEFVKFLNPKGLVGFIRDLALVPSESFDKIGSAMASCQIKTFRVFSKPKDHSTPGKNEPEGYSISARNEPKDDSTLGKNESEDDSTLPTNEPKDDPTLGKSEPATLTTNEPKDDSTPSRNESKDKSAPARNKPNGYSTPATNEPKDNSTPARNEILKRRKTTKPRKTPLNQTKSISPSPKRQKITTENQSRTVIVPVAKKRYDEQDPTALLLNFSTKYAPVPNEGDLKRIFSRYGSLKGEIEKGIEGSQNKVKIVFKTRADADLAFGGLREDNLFEKTLISYRLVELNEMEKKSSVPNGEDRPECFKGLCNCDDYSFKILEHFNMRAHKSHGQSPEGANPNPNPTSNLETNMHRDDKLLHTNPNPNLNPNFETVADDTLLYLNPNPETTSLNPNPNPETNSPNPDPEITSPNPNLEITIPDPNSETASPNPNPNHEPINAGEITFINPNQSNSIAIVDKTSPIWQALLEKEGFKIPPKQDPHFNKLLSEGYPKKQCESLALVLMARYSSFVESILLLSLNDDVAVFQDKLSRLGELEENGFNVNRIRTCLNNLIQLKTDNMVKTAELENNISEKEEEYKGLEELLKEVNWKLVDNSEIIKEENEGLNKFRVERDEWLVFTRENRVNISRLEREIQISKKLDEEDREEFKRLAEEFEC